MFSKHTDRIFRWCRREAGFHPDRVYLSPLGVHVQRRKYRDASPIIAVSSSSHSPRFCAAEETVCIVCRFSVTQRRKDTGSPRRMTRTEYVDIGRFLADFVIISEINCMYVTNERTFLHDFNAPDTILLLKFFLLSISSLFSWAWVGRHIDSLLWHEINSAIISHFNTWCHRYLLLRHVINIFQHCSSASFRSLDAQGSPNWRSPVIVSGSI